MAKARAEKSFKQIQIFFSRQDITELIRSMDETLEVFRKQAWDGLMPVLEVLESLRFKIQCALYTDNSIEKNQPLYSFALSPVQAFYYARLLDKAFNDHLKAGNELPSEHRERIMLFMQKMNNPIKEAIDENEYYRLTSINQYDVSFLYIQYLNFLYEDRLQEPSSKKNLALLIMLCDGAQGNQSNNRILPYDVFSQRCDTWMRKHNTDYICLDEIIADESFSKL
ncbi:hypothetical protein LJC74_02490 [Eubacteriales bacterium OttesenSCG-928-A19]|nr:hypothetical protein [Eubacteriales bacterium OttesenSCG-928-A19]